MPTNLRLPAKTPHQRELEAALDRLASRHCDTIVVGPPGCGKSTLLRTYQERFKDRHSAIVFVTGVELGKDGALRLIFEEAARYSGGLERKNAPALIIVDGLDEAPPEAPVHELIDGMRSVDAQFLLSSRPSSHQLFGASAAAGHDFELLRLSGYTKADLAALMDEQGISHSAVQVERLSSLSGGIPLIASLVVSQLRSGTLTWDQLELAFAEFERPGVLRPDGRPADPLGHETAVVVSDVAATNERILLELQQHPERMLGLPPRKFEEFVAGMLQRQGYDVELTPASKDGGFDMYVASKQSLGSFLYLVECKRYTPPKKVGVQIVRALHGVVQKVRANAGMVVTSSFFTRGAENYAAETMFELHLHDFFALKRWLRLL
jgi:hypothetical protein